MRGFDVSEFESRVARAQAMMNAMELDALLLTTEPEVRYFTGFLTRFWESPTRPWFLIIPAQGKPIAVIPSIGAALMGKTWIDDIRTWLSPDLDDDGVSLLSDTLAEVVPNHGRIGTPMGPETHLRMPLADFEALSETLAGREMRGDEGIIRQLRMVKSDAEIAKIEEACAIAARAFERVPEIATEGTTVEEVFRRFQMLALAAGADWVPYLAGGAGQGGYDDVISPAGTAPLSKGDVLMIDTGLVWDGYFCDYDRNWSLGPPEPKVADAHKCLIEATNAGFESARPGSKASDVYAAMNAVLSRGGADTGAGRLGHGLGMSLTEWPSLIPGDHTVLEPGMALTLEPGCAIEDKILVHEENIVITDTGARWITGPAAPEIMVL